MLLNSTEFSKKVEHSLLTSSATTIVLSSFVKEKALLWVLDATRSSSVKVVARWRKHDLLCGASDFNCYMLCRDRGIPFGVSLNLHGKVYYVDNQLFVGSGNLTSSGMALSKNFNDEFGVGFEAGKGDEAKIHKYLQSVKWLDDEIVARMYEDLKSSEKEETYSNQVWAEAIDTELISTTRNLWIHELLFTSPTKLLKFDARNEHHLHDYQLLGLNLDSLNKENLVAKFVNCNAFRWLLRTLQDEGRLSFGGVSAHLHNDILDDPIPYRREIKDLVVNLFAWAEFTPDIFEISRPRHSQVIKLCDNYKN